MQLKCTIRMIQAEASQTTHRSEEEQYQSAEEESLKDIRGGEDIIELCRRRNWHRQARNWKHCMWRSPSFPDHVCGEEESQEGIC